MADDKNKIGKPDRSKVAGGEEYEVQHLADQAGIPPAQARALIRRHGNDRDMIMKEAKKLKRR